MLLYKRRHFTCLVTVLFSAPRRESGIKQEDERVFLERIIILKLEMEISGVSLSVCPPNNIPQIPHDLFFFASKYWHSEQGCVNKYMNS